MPSFRNLLSSRRSKEKPPDRPPSSTAPAPAQSSVPPHPAASQSGGSASVAIPSAQVVTLPLRHLPARNLWDEALEQLRKKDKDLVAHYGEILRQEEANLTNAAGAATAPIVTTRPLDNSTLIGLIEAKIDKVEKQCSRADYLDKVIKIVIAAKDFISSAASAEPHAALAWAGVSLLLPQRSDFAAGLEAIPDILCRSQLYKHNIESQHSSDTANSIDRFLSGTVKLYSLILEYQARAVCQDSRHVILQYSRNVFKSDDWKPFVSQIKTQDAVCKDIWTALSTSSIRTTLAQQVKGWEDAAAEFRKANLQQQSRDQQYCHQAFFVDAAEQKNRNPSRVPGTCEWLLQNVTFLDWQQSLTASVLWITAEPGCGKSVLCKTLVDEQLLGVDRATAKVCYYFFKDNLPENRSATKALASLIHQLFSHDTTLIDHAMPAFGRTGPRLASSFDQTWTVFENAINDSVAGEVVCLFDALDECEKDGRKRLIAALSDLFASASQGGAHPKVKFIITSRPYEEIYRAFRGSSVSNQMIELRANENHERLEKEITLVIQDRIPLLAKKLDLDREASLTVQEALLSVENKTYLWWYLMIDALENKIGITTSEDIKAFVSCIPSTVDDMYETLLNRSDDKTKAKKILAIVVGAVRPLTLRELNIAQAIKGSEDSIDELKVQRDDHFESTARNVCGLLLTFYDGKAFLLHQTTKEFLLSDTDLISDGVWKHSLSSKLVKLELTKICLTYLLLVRLESGPCADNASMSRRLAMNPLFDYASRYWGVHAQGETEIDLKHLIFKLISMESRISSIAQAMTIVEEEKWNWLQMSFQRRIASQKYPRGINHMHLVACFGLSHVLVDIFQGISGLPLSDGEINATDDNDRTPLFWAAERGQDAVVGLLLGREDVKVNCRDTSGYTPLSQATREGHEAVVSLLLGREDVEINCKADYDWTALSWAARGGYEAIVKLLLGRKEIEVYSRGSRRSTPLFNAAIEGHEVVVRLLLGHNDSGADSRDVLGRTPLSWAAGHGREAVVRALLKYDVDADSRDLEGRTPLSWAAENKFRYGDCEAVVKILLSRTEVEVDSKDLKGRTPLSWAAEYGKEAVVRRLLENDVDADSRDLKGRTPLSWAAEDKFGHEECCKAIVEMLLGRSEVEVDSRDFKGRTPLSWAASKGQEAVVRRLLEHNVDADSRDSGGRTPLSWAAEYGSVAVVEQLLPQNVEAESQDKNGRTEDAYDEKSRKTVSKTLLRRDEVRVNAQDIHGRTPLWWAASQGGPWVVALLLEQEDIEADLSDNDGLTPLALAMKGGHKEVIEAFERYHR